jgi:hypothetical protein
MEKTWNFDENKLIASAKALGIKITRAELGSDICQCWADRVLYAQKAFDDGDMAECQAAIEDANIYAI